MEWNFLINKSGEILKRLLSRRQPIQDFLVNALSISRCTLCGGSCQQHSICRDCLADLPWLANACPGCALPHLGDDRCEECQLRPPAWTQACALWQFRFPIDRLIAAYKYQHALHLTGFFSHFLAEAYPFEPPELLLPVPIHRHRLRQRGYQQTVLIARRLARDWRIPCHMHALQRIKDTAMQKTLSAEARWQNLQGAFAYHGSPLTGRHVALLDDVLTTGATATHLSELLWQQGAARVTVICLARTLP